MRVLSGFPTIVIVLAAAGFSLAAQPARAAAFDGKWVADIPAEGRCNYTGVMTVLVAGDALSGETYNSAGTNVSVANFTGKIDPDGSANIVVNGLYVGTMKFSGDRFDATWNNGNCDRHAQGDRALDGNQRAALTAERRQHQARYADLIRRAESGDRTVDYTALRGESVYAETWDFYDTKAQGLVDQAAAAAKGKDCAVALEKLDQIIRLDFTIDSAHALRSDCLKQAGNSAGARIESDIADGLIHSLMDSGSGGDHGLIHVLAGADGASEQTAYVANSLREEMDVLANRHIQIKTRQTAIRGSNGRYYDVIQGATTHSTPDCGTFQSGGQPEIACGPPILDVTVKTLYFDVTGFVAGRASRRAAEETAQASVH